MLSKLSKTFDFKLEQRYFVDFFLKGEGYGKRIKNLIYNSMKYKGGKLKMVPYETKDQERLVELISESSQGFLVSDVLVSALTKNLTDVDEYHRIWLVECDCSPGTKLGSVILQKISQEHNSAELIVTFDDAEICHDPVVFKTVLDDVLEYVFADLDLLRLQVEILENNLKLRKAYKEIGFLEEGLLRSKYEVKGRRYDAYVMSILKIEWARLRN